MCGNSVEREVLRVSLMVATEERDDQEGKEEVKGQGDDSGNDNGLP